MIKFKTAWITGIEGQDGYYMKEYLNLLPRYIVHGSTKEECDITSPEFDEILIDIQPDEIYNFAGNSDNAEAFEDPEQMLKDNTIPIIKILNYQKKVKKETRFFQASSSLIFGSNNENKIQHLITPKDPKTPYGASKLYAYNIIETYKSHYGIYAVNGILYNHTSLRQREYFIVPKIVKGLIEYSKTGKILEVGDIEAKRDWTHAKDIVRGAYLSLQQDYPRNYIFSSGKLTSVKYLIEYVAKKLGINWAEAIKTNPAFISKKQENNYAGSNKYTEIFLNWIPKYSIEDILDELIEYYKEKNYVKI